MSARRPGTADTAVADTQTSDATLATESGAGSGSGVQAQGSIRGSRPSLTGGPDYPELHVVDPAHYALEREIARGGMGRIWVARDRRLGRDVALKEVLVDTGAIVRRFEREARITARLQHPSIVSVHEAGVWPSGEPFYAMRLVSGRSLDEAIGAADGFAGRLALLPNVLAAADAMAYAHGQRVIHRDLKPRNVVVGDFGETVVIDWGLAKELGVPSADSLDGELGLVSSGGSSSPGETTAGDILGTPAYMPPEQAAGQAVDERADVYALGAMLYHLLANEPPYRLPSGAEVIAAVMVEPPTPVSERAPATPRELVAIVERAMARDPAARYPSARELAEDLRRFQTGQLVGAYRYSTGQLVRRWMRRHRTAIAAVAAAAIVSVVIGVVALTRIFAAERRVEAESAHALASRTTAEELSQFMIDNLEKKLVAVGRLDLLDVVARRAAAYYETRGDEGTDEDRYDLATARNTLGGTFEKRNDMVNARVEWDKAELLLAALIVREPSNVKYGAEMLRVRTNVGILDIWSGHSAEQVFRPIMADADALLAAHPHDPMALHAAATAHATFAGSLEHSDPPASLAESARSLELANQLAALSTDRADQKVVMQVHETRGELIAMIKHDNAGALAEYRLAIASAEKLVAADPQDTDMLDRLASIRSELGRGLLEGHDFVGAKAELEAARAIAERLHRLEPSNQSWFSTLQTLDTDMGRMLATQGDYPGALAHYRASEAALGELSAGAPSNLSVKANLATTLRNIGQVQMLTHQLVDASASYQRAADMTQSLLAVDPNNVDWQHALYATKKAISQVASMQKGHGREAVATLREALAIIRNLADEHATNTGYLQDLVETHVNIGQVMLEDLHDRAGARAEFRLALDIAGRIPPDDPRFAPFVASIKKLLAPLEHPKK